MIVLNFCDHYLCFILYGVHSVLESKICPKCDKLCSFDKCFLQSDRPGSLPGSFSCSRAVLPCLLMIFLKENGTKDASWSENLF